MQGGGVCASGGGEGRDGEDGSAGEEGRKGGGVDARSGEGLGVLLGGYGSDSESGSEKEPWNEEALG